MCVGVAKSAPRGLAELLAALAKYGDNAARLVAAMKVALERDPLFKDDPHVETIQANDPNTWKLRGVPRKYLPVLVRLGMDAATHGASELERVEVPVPPITPGDVARAMERLQATASPRVYRRVSEMVHGMVIALTDEMSQVRRGRSKASG